MSNARRMRSATAAVLTAFLCGLIVPPGATRWLPEGRADVGHVVLPAVLFPMVRVVFARSLYAARRRHGRRARRGEHSR